MKMTRMKTYSPNYNLAERKALEFLKLSNSKELPIKIQQFKKIFKDLEIVKFSVYAKKEGLTIEEVCEGLETEDGLITFNPINNKYRIMYNDTIENEGRKRWTLAHELGHYALNHLERMDVPILRRSETKNDKDNPFEKEANCFARNILAPPHVIFHLEEKDPSIIEQICKVSSEAAQNIFRFLYRGVREYGIGYSKDYAEKLGFKDFLHQVNNRYFCKNCRVHYTIEKPSYCSCCGNESLTKTIYKFGDEFEMKYPALVEVDFKGRAKVCPCCQNEELDYDGNYCNICSAYLVNECADLYDDDPFGNQEILVESCGTKLSGNARYCHKCGNPSRFMNAGHLRAWHYTPIERDELEDLPF